MKAKLIVEGKEFPIEIQDPELQKLLVPPKKTGYERMLKGERYYRQGTDGNCLWDFDSYEIYDDNNYDAANYYSDETVAINNARADKLMRQLRRFAVEHREKSLNWNKKATSKWFIEYSYPEGCLYASYHCACRHFGGIYFDSSDICDLAINTFKDELIWYFTEYKDSL